MWERRTYHANGAALTAAIFTNSQLVGFQDKCLLPTYDVFTERRYFEPGGPIRPWVIEGKKIAITICEDLWQHSTLLESISYPRDPVLDLSYYKPDIVLNLSASPYSIGKIEKRVSVCTRVSKTLHCPVLLCNQVGGNDGLIFDGSSIYVNAEGKVQSLAKTFEEDFMLIDLDLSPASYSYHENPIKDLYNALVIGLKDYFEKSGFTKACLGLSGGIDSAVVACIAVEALGKENVLGVAMPSRILQKVVSPMPSPLLGKNLGIPYKEIPIEKPFTSYLDLLNPHFDSLPADSTEENLQARIRGMILMAISNKLGYIVLSTGNKSELAMGYATLYGDMCGGLAILSDVSKRQVYALANWINNSKEIILETAVQGDKVMQDFKSESFVMVGDHSQLVKAPTITSDYGLKDCVNLSPSTAVSRIIPISTITKAPSAELRPNQKDSDSLPDYEIIDNV